MIHGKAWKTDGISNEHCVHFNGEAETDYKGRLLDYCKYKDAYYFSKKDICRGCYKNIQSHIEEYFCPFCKRITEHHRYKLGERNVWQCIPCSYDNNAGGFKTIYLKDLTQDFKKRGKQITLNEFKKSGVVV